MFCKDDEKIRAIQEELLIDLKEFHKICVEHNIKYSLHGGTLLGAVREHGFIPWDDDVDVSMTREEYEKFLNALRSTVLPEHFRFGILERWPMLFLQREGRPCAHVDIFICDGISGHSVFRKLKCLGIAFLSGMLKERELLKVTKARNNGKIKYMLFYLAFLAGRPFSRERKYRWLESFSKKWFCGDGKLLHRSNDQYRGVGVIFPKSYTESFELIPFEDTELMVSKNRHEILVQAYGEDYMTPIRFGESQTTVHDLGNEYISHHSAVDRQNVL